MLRHIVLFKFKEGTEPQQIHDISGAMDALPGQVPSILAYTHGRDAALSTAKFDYAVVADFASEEDYVTYRDHPAHKALGGEVMKLVADVAQMQFYC